MGMERDGAPRDLDGIQSKLLRLKGLDGFKQEDAFRGMEVARVTKSELLGRITLNPNVMVGKPVIKGTRLTVQYILGLMAQGATVEEILAEYPGLTREDVLACLLFAAEALDNAAFLPLQQEAV